MPVSGIDWYPTFLELGGVPTPEQQDIATLNTLTRITNRTRTGGAACPEMNDDRVQPIVTEAVLAAARGASPESPAWILPVGAGTNVASAILQARREGLDLKQRIRIIWLGGHAKDYHKEHNGHYDPWSVYVMRQSGIDMQILLSHPTSLKLNIG